MAVQNRFNNLKEGSKEDKTVVAGSIAVSVIIILLAAWAIYFLRSVRNNSEQLNLSGGQQEQFFFSSTREAQAELEQQFSDTDELIDVRNRAASGGTSVQQQVVEQQTQGSSESPFGQ